MVGLFGALFGVIGVGLLGIGVLNLQKWQTMRAMDPGGASTIDAGLQEVEGRARSVNDPVTAPFSGTDSLVCQYKVERHDITNEEGSDWNTLTTETETVPFEIEGGGEAVAVNPAHAQHLLTREFRLDTSNTDEYPPGVQEYLDGGETIDIGPVELGGRDGRLRFTEKRLDEGEEVYVLGPAKRSPSAVPEGSDARVGIDPDERGLKEWVFGDPFIVSDSGEQQAESRQLKRSLFVVAIGVIILGVALFVVVA